MLRCFFFASISQISHVDYRMFHTQPILTMSVVVGGSFVALLFTRSTGAPTSDFNCYPSLYFVSHSLCVCVFSFVDIYRISRVCCELCCSLCAMLSFLQVFSIALIYAYQNIQMFIRYIYQPLFCTFIRIYTKM